MSIEVVVGGQFGSEAKGHVAAILVADAARVGGALSRPVGCVRIGGPNAGHTVVDDQDRAFAFRTLPVASVVDPRCNLIIGPGSEIEVEVLKDEIERVEEAGYVVRDRLFIDQQATIITWKHKESEEGLRQRIGSTAKGVGAARADRIMRQAPIARDEPDLHELGLITDTTPISRLLANDGTLVIEGTQGYGLGLHAGFYPFCTSGDCRAIDFMGQAGVSRSFMPWIVYRTFPIRVAGNSGPMFEETTWGYLNGKSNGYIKPEMTTVTKKTRRVGHWDYELAAQALAANGPGASLVLSFVDYLDPEMALCEELSILQQSPAWLAIQKIEEELGAKFVLFTTGANTHIWRM